MKVKLTLVKKLSLYFILIMITAFVLIYFGVSGMMVRNNEETIDEDMGILKENITSYIDQTIALRSGEIEMFGLSYVMQDVVEEMNLVFGSKFGIYHFNGNAIYSTEHYSQSTTDIEKAKEGYACYIINYRADSTYVHYSFPINMNNEQYIIRAESDYTELYSNSEYITTVVILGCAVILLGALVLLVLMLVDVASPINRLSIAMRNTADNPDKITPINLDRNDEIGLLAKDYNYMAATIKEQMRLIENEKDALNKTLEYRKAFFDNITHELKTPLTIIIGYAEMIDQTDFEDKEFNKKGIENIIKESKRLKNMVSELLESTRATSIPEGKLRAFFIDDTIYEAAHDMDIKAQRFGFDIKCRCERGEVLGDPDLIRRLMTNLLDNAIKYGVNNLPITVNGGVSGFNYCISVENELPEENSSMDVSKIFMPFYRSREEDKKESGSVGLGLAICKSIVLAHKGTISAEVDNKKIVFKIDIPLNMRGRESE